MFKKPEAPPPLVAQPDASAVLNNPPPNPPMFGSQAAGAKPKKGPAPTFLGAAQLAPTNSAYKTLMGQ